MSIASATIEVNKTSDENSKLFYRILIKLREYKVELNKLKIKT